MLLSLHIRDFVIVDRTAIEFDQGFTVFSGETGAGKSILIDALSLALGARADVSAVREGAERAEITAIFDPSTEAIAWLIEHELLEAPEGFEEAQEASTRVADESSQVASATSSESESISNVATPSLADLHELPELMLRRTISREGRSRAYINGTPCTLAQLQALGALLIDIHGQHAHQQLLNTQSQRRLLDEHAQLMPQLAELGQRWQRWQRSEQALATLIAEESARQSQLAHLRWQFEELEQLKPLEDEWEQLDQAFNRLANAAALLEGVGAIAHTLDGDEQQVSTLLNRCVQQLTQLSKHAPELNPLVESLESARIICADTASELNHFLSDVELDPQRLEQTERRMRQLFDTAKKFNVEVEQLPTLHSELEQQLLALEQDSDVSALEQRIAQERADYMALAQNISQRRQAVAEHLSQEVTQVMQELAMQGGRFEVELRPCEPSAHGLEQVQFNVAGHAGTTPRAINKIASGGELARISLALSVIANKAGQVPTLIFDEVDSGIGGAVAEIVGRLLRQLGQSHQVLCVTHLAQVAACGHHHFEVIKSEDKGVTRSDIRHLDEAARIKEVARMLGGLTISDTTLKHAQEMLNID